jgi:xanthine/CO dehydrogenase XdhC/CoxF family maturation factor
MTIQTNLTDPLLTAEHWMEAGRAVAIATVIETWGSAPRPVGSHLVVDGDGSMPSGYCKGSRASSRSMDMPDIIG